MLNSEFSSIKNWLFVEGNSSLDFLVFVECNSLLGFLLFEFNTSTLSLDDFKVDLKIDF